MKRIKTVFTDKASLILRKMLQDPARKWNISDFTEEGVSLGWASEILREMEKEGYIERISKGYLSYSLLRNPERLIEDWIKWYRFSYNTIYNFYSPERGIEKRLICSKTTLSRMP